MNGLTRYTAHAHDSLEDRLKPSRSARSAVRGVCSALALALACFVGSARAQPARTELVQLSIPDCAGASGAEITKLTSLELARQEQLIIDPTRPATLSASLRCETLHAEISVQKPGAPRPLLLVLELASIRSEARARLLALSIAELIATSLLEVTSEPEPEPEPEPERTTPPRGALWLGLGVLRGFEPGRWAPSLALGGALRLRLFAATADVSFDWSEQTRSEATVRARVLSLSLAPRLRLTRGRWAWDAGIGLRLGVAWLSAQARAEGLSGKSVSGLFLSPVLQSALCYGLAARWAMRLGLELGYTVRSVRGLDADGALLLALDKLRVAPSLAVELAL